MQNLLHQVGNGLVSPMTCAQTLTTIGALVAGCLAGYTSMRNHRR